MRLLQVVPRLPAALDGVSGYATALSQALSQRGVASHFFVAARGWSTAAHEGPAATPIPEGDASGAAFSRRLAESGAGRVLVHYVNYGYHSRGCPSGLVRGLARWRAEAPERRLITMFHEVYASGPPWRSSFWLGPWQRRLAAQLLRASDGAATSLPLYGRMLARFRPRREVVVAPVFSAVGEPAAVPAPGERRPRVMLVFGGAGNRRRAYGEQREALAAACQALQIAEIIDLGPPLAELPAAVGGRPVRALGARSKEEVASVMLRCFAGFLAYPPGFLPKSTVFASYCAYGLVPVCAGARREPLPAAERPPCWEPGREAVPTDVASLAARARAWYRAHDLARQAAVFHALLLDSASAVERQG